MAKYGSKITNISINWGDGSKPFYWPDNIARISKRFSFNHTYYTISSYLITVTAHNTRGFDLIQNVTTTGILYEHYLPSDSPLRVSESANSILQISVTSNVIESDAPMHVDVKLSYLNGSGIENNRITITAIWIGNPDVYTNIPSLLSISDTKPRVFFPESKPNGEYIAVIEPHMLPVGKYKIVAQPEPEGQRYVDFNVTKEVTVLDPAITFDQFITYLSIGIGIAVSIIGAIVKVPGYFRGKKQARILRSCIQDINDEYNKFRKSTLHTYKDQYLEDLEGLRFKFMNKLVTQDITADQYKILDDMISAHSNRIK